MPSTFGAAPAMRENSKSPVSDEATEIFADRVDLLYRLGRYHLFIPFSALCFVAILHTGRETIMLAALPLLLQILTVVVSETLGRAYAERDRADDPHKWSGRYTLMSAAAGAAWGAGAIIWFIPDSFPAQAFLSLAFLGMTAAEFISRSAHRPAYVAHASFSLGPLVLRLLWVGNLYANLTALLVLFFGGVLYSYCDGFAGILDEGIRLRRHNAKLVEQLSREKTEAEIARDMAEASTRAKSAFVANISHEIRTPLNALLGMAQLLERSELDRSQRSHVKVLLEAGKGLKTLLDDVIALSRDEGEVGHAQSEDCDPAQAVRTVARLLQPRAWEKQIKLVATAPSNLPRVAADPRRVRQVLLKLADNALKFTQRGSVELRVDSEFRDDGAKMLKFSIMDTGLGIPAELAANVFEPFTSADTTYARRQDGAGLGLAVAKRMIEQLDGEIGFDSETGQGSTFWFTVPSIGAAQAEQREAAAIATDAPPPWGLSILVWCSDESGRLQIGNMLEPFGNRLVFAQNVSDATALAGREVFDAVIAVACDADTLAAAPGVHAPILALLRDGERPPVAVGVNLHWPAGASALYAGMRELLGRGVEAGIAPDAKQQAIAAIDAPAFAALEKSLGLATLIEILHAYIAAAENLCSGLSETSDKEGWDEAVRIAQDIAGAAGGLGLAALTAAARNFAQKVREGDGAVELKGAARAIVDEHQRVCRALSNLYPELAA